MDDAVVLAASAAGDAAAFETFMRHYQPSVSRYLQTYTGSSDVDDVVQETFIAAWRGAGGYRGAASARAARGAGVAAAEAAACAPDAGGSEATAAKAKPASAPAVSR
jgi:hypothetical protein